MKKQPSHTSTASHTGTTAQKPSLPAWQSRTALGFDVHAFEDRLHPQQNQRLSKRRLVLCGLDFDHLPLEGHSDADVGLHAITDALYGTLAKGDIGSHFPPSDPQWKGVSSDIFLRAAARDVYSHNGFIEFIDLTLVCETPKIGPHSQEMRSLVAKMLDLPVASIAIKATTTEKLGFTGRQEGIAALAAATVLYPRNRN